MQLLRRCVKHAWVPDDVAVSLRLTLYASQGLLHLHGCAPSSSLFPFPASLASLQPTL